ncbi:MAG: GNAT family N-acetyltransferase [Candidatus Buchananbacteria bacterium]|nr:GNAT family N-acetyltransferase [Candidatus Buchananbacteria bacterium]
MKSPESLNHEQEPAEIKSLEEFDMEFFQEMEGENGWIALGQDNCLNPQYFTVIGTKGEKLGIVGVYDTEDEKNITHTVVDPKYRGQGLAAKFKQLLMDKLSLPFITLTIDIDNKKSIRAAENLGAIKTSSRQYEDEFHKFRYTYKPVQKNQSK